MTFKLVAQCPLCRRPCASVAIYALVKLQEGQPLDEIYYLMCECGLIFHMWMMTPEEIKRYYNGPYREAIGNSSVTEANAVEQLARAGKLLEFMRDDIAPSRVLDIGSSTGILLDKIKEKYECHVMGVEPCDSFREYSCALGVDAIDDIERLNGRRKFDLITMVHTLEHFTEPMPLLEKVRGLITDDGTLLVEVPIMGCGLAHPIVFTEETLGKMLNKAGFTIERKTVDEKNILVKAYCDT